MTRPHPRIVSRGFSLIELMVGLAVGLVCTLAITQIMLTSEGQKRSTTSGSDAQVNGVLAIDSLRNAVQEAGYGFSSMDTIIGCPLVAKYNNADIVGFPSNLVPVLITDGANGAPDTVRVLKSAKNTFSVPVAVVDPGYNPGDNTRNKAFPVLSSSGVVSGDLVIAATTAATACEVFQVTSAPTPTSIPRADNAALWNPPGRPTLQYLATNQSATINMGSFSDTTFSISANSTLQMNRLVLGANSAPSYTGNTDLFSNIVNLQAYYGKASGITGAVTMAPIDSWDAVTPTDNAGWRQVVAVKLAIVTRGDQYEKTEVTSADPLWEVGANSNVAGATTPTGCASTCVTLTIPRTQGSTDWKHYRYRVFDTVIPLRNMIYNR